MEGAMSPGQAGCSHPAGQAGGDGDAAESAGRAGPAILACGNELSGPSPAGRRTVCPARESFDTAATGRKTCRHRLNTPLPLLCRMHPKLSPGEGRRLLPDSSLIQYKAQSPKAQPARPVFPATGINSPKEWADDVLYKKGNAEQAAHTLPDCLWGRAYPGLPQPISGGGKRGIRRGFCRRFS